MQWLTLRPTFQVELNESRQAAIDRLRDAYKEVGQREKFLMHGEYGELHLPAEDHRFWSPHLSFYVSNDQPTHTEKCIVHGRFAPRLEVWTFVWVIYLAMAFTAFFGAALAYSQWQLGQPTWGFTAVVLGLLAIAVLYVTAAVGQSWSVDQMQLLRGELDQILHSGHLQCDQDES